MRDIANILVYVFIRQKTLGIRFVLLSLTPELVVYFVAVLVIVKVIGVAVMKKIIKAIKYIVIFCVRGFGILLMVTGFLGAFGVLNETNEHDAIASDPQVEGVSAKN
jgi:hypothetical protein